MKTVKIFGKSIPLLAIIAIITVGLVSAAVYISVTQYITQDITPELDYGTITAPSFNLPNMAVSDSITHSQEVTVDLTALGVGKEFSMAMESDALYTNFDVTIQCTSKPAGSDVPTYGLGISGGGVIGIQLDVAGLYTFTETIEATAGNNEGTAESTITFSLVDYEGPPPR